MNPLSRLTSLVVSSDHKETPTTTHTIQEGGIIPISLGEIKDNSRSPHLGFLLIHIRIENPFLKIATLGSYKLGG